MFLLQENGGQERIEMFSESKVTHMSKRFMFEKPMGMRDTLPEHYEKKKTVVEGMCSTMQSWGYRMIGTPTVEYSDTIGRVSAIEEQQLFTLMDRDGHSLVLRPDMTSPIARVASSKLAKERLPLRLAYEENVFRAQQREGGRPAEFTQVGVELIGDKTFAADAEIIAIADEALRAVGLRSFKFLLGHIGFVKAFFRANLDTAEQVDALLRALYEKNLVGYGEAVESFQLQVAKEERLRQFLHLRGGEDLFQRAESLIQTEEERNALGDVHTMFAHLKDYQVEATVKLDLTLVSHMTYYTGLLFEVYAGDVGAPIGNGGRYNQLVRQFGTQHAATGFAIRVDHLLEALPAPNPLSTPYGVLFDDESRTEAVEQAKKIRSTNQRVILQHVAGVEELTAFFGACARVIDMRKGGNE